MLDQDEIVQKREELHRMPCVRHADWRDRHWLGPAPVSGEIGWHQHQFRGLHVNTDKEQLLVRTLGDGLICVNGCMVGDAGQLLCDGDRLGIEGAHIFRAQLHKKPKDEGMASSNESEFERTMCEISACAEVDPLRKNGTQNMMLIVKSDFGIEDATQLLQQTTNASDVIVYGMTFNPTTPSRDKVWRAILSSLARPTECRGKLMVSLSRKRTVTR